MEGDRTTALKARLQEFNSDVKRWGYRSQNAMRGSAAGNMKAQNLSNSLRANFRQESTQFGRRVFNIGFKFPREGVYIHYGVGRGYNRIGGQMVRTAKFAPRDPDKIRRPKDWFNPIVRSKLPELDKVVENYGDGLVVNSMRIMLPDNT